MEKLEEIYFEGNNIKDDGWHRIFEASVKKSSLKIVDPSTTIIIMYEYRRMAL